MDKKRRAAAREIAQSYLAAGDALGWFENLYSQAGGDASVVPWADLIPNPNLVEWFDLHQVTGTGRKAIKIGCGLGDDAEELNRRGFETTAFDISTSAIAWCKERFPQSSVAYVAADLFQLPSEWRSKFDFVLESYTLQVLPPDLRNAAIDNTASLVAPLGTLLVIARGRETDEDKGEMPWPVTRDELALFQAYGLKENRFENFMDNEDPPVRRFRVAYRKDEYENSFNQANDIFRHF